MVPTELTWDFEVDPPEGWYRWECYPQRRAEFDAAQVDAWIEVKPELAEHREQILEVLADFGAHADRSFAYAAATKWEPAGDVPDVAHFMVAGGERRHPQDNAREIEHLLEVLPKPGDGDVSARTVEEMALDAGPAARMRVIAKAPKARRRDPDVVLDTIQYWVPVPQRDEMIVLVGTTPSLGPREDFASTIDAIVASLRFTYFS
jgi:hypothetical protein